MCDIFEITKNIQEGQSLLNSNLIELNQLCFKQYRALIDIKACASNNDIENINKILKDILHE